MTIEKYKKPEASPFQKAIMNNSEIDSKVLGLEEKFAQPLHELKSAIASLVEYEIISSSEFLDGIEIAIPDYKIKYQDLMMLDVPNMPEIPELPSMPDVPSLDISKLDIEVPSLKLPSVPSVTIPDVGKDLMKVADTMSDVSTDLKNQIGEIASTALLEMTKATLEGVFDSLFSAAGSAHNPPLNRATTYGAKNLNTMLDSSAGPFSTQGQCGVSKAFEELGIPTEIFLDFDPDNAPEQDPVSPGSVKTMIDDISAALTPLEIVDLLEGTATPETIKIVENTITNGYPAYMLRLKETTNVADAFSNLGRYVNPNSINAIKKAARIYPNPGSGLLCEDDKREEEQEITELQQRLGGSVSATALQRAKEQIKRKRRHRRQKLKKLLSIAQNADSVLKDLLPPTVNNCGEKVTNLSDTGDGVLSGIGGLLPKNHESMKYMNKKVIKNMFEIPNMHFNMEVNTYLDSLLKEEFRAPQPQDDQYQGFLSALEVAGLGEDDISKGLANDLDDQAKFNEVLARNQKLNIQVAPDVKNSFLNIGNFFKNEKRQFEMKTSFIEYAFLQGSLDTLKEKKEILEQKVSEKNKLLKSIEEIDSAENLKGKIYDHILKVEGDIDTAQENVQEAIKELAPDVEPGAAIEKDAKIIFGNDAAAKVGIEESLINYIPENNYHLTLDKPSALFVLKAFDETVITGGTDSLPPLTELDDYSFLEPPSEKEPWTWQEESFANYMIKRWEETPLPSPDFDANIFSYFCKNKQMYIFTHLVRNLMSFISKSPLFSVNSLENLELANDENDPETTSSPCPPPLKPGLLDINKYQEVVNNLYDEACEEVSKESLKSSTLETSGIQGIVYTTIRLYVLEALLKSIFTFSRFSFSEIRGNTLYTEVLAQSVLFGLRSLDNEYYNDVLKQAKIITDKRQEGGEKLFNPLSVYTEESEEDETLGDPNDPRTLSGISSLRFLIKEQIFLLATEMDGRLKPPIKDLDSFFLGIDGSPSLITTMQVPEHREQNRTEELIYEGTYEGTNDVDTNDVDPNIHGIKKEWLPILDGPTGGFILETYIRLEDAYWYTVPAGQNETIVAEFFEEWINRPGGSKHRFETVYKPGESSGGPPGLTDREKEVKKVGHLSGVVNARALKAYLESLASKWGNFNLKNVVRNFKFGIRLCYIPSVQKDGDPLGNAEQDDFGAIFAASALPGMDEIYNNSIIEKTYWLDEYYNYTILSDLPPEAQDVNSMVDKTWPTLSRTIHPTPLITIEDSMGLDSLPELTVNDAIALLSPTASNLAFNGLKKQMIKTPKYQFLFNYIFPLSRMLSLVSIYNMLSVSENVDGAKDMFSMTKDSFKSVFYTLTPEDPWYSKQDKKHEAAGGNVGMMQRDNNSMTMTGPSSLPSAAKIASRAALILLKASARRSDPHYAFVSKLDDKGGAPFGMTWGSVPVFWPVNFLFGWGPPLGPLGMVAYSAGLLPGEKKKKKERAAKEASAKGETCADNIIEEDFTAQPEDFD